MRRSILLIGISLAACQDQKLPEITQPPLASRDQIASVKPIEGSRDQVASTAPILKQAPPKPVASRSEIGGQIAALTKCATDIGCQAYTTVVAFGSVAADDLITVATDVRAPINQRRLALKALQVLTDPNTVAMKVFRAAKSMAGTGALSAADFYGAAAASRTRPVFDAMIGEYEKLLPPPTDDRELALRHGLRAYPKEVVGWAAAAIRREHPAQVAELVADVATTAEQVAVAALLDATTDQPAKHRLATKLIELGANDAVLFAILENGLVYKDPRVVADAARHLAMISSKIPPDMKPWLVERLAKVSASATHPVVGQAVREALVALEAN